MTAKLWKDGVEEGSGEEEKEQRNGEGKGKQNGEENGEGEGIIKEEGERSPSLSADISASNANAETFMCARPSIIVPSTSDGPSTCAGPKAIAVPNLSAAYSISAGPSTSNELSTRTGLSTIAGPNVSAGHSISAGSSTCAGTSTSKRANESSTNSETGTSTGLSINSKLDSSTGALMRTSEEDLARIKTRKAKSKARADIASYVSSYLRRRSQRQKELECLLLPDAPPRKRVSKEPSPERSACRLVPGTPTKPPPPKLQPWQIRQAEQLTHKSGAVRRLELQCPAETDKERSSPSEVLDGVTVDLRPNTTVYYADEHLTEGTLISLPSDSAAQSLPPDVKQSSSLPKRKQCKVLPSSGAPDMLEQCPEERDKEKMSASEVFDWVTIEFTDTAELCPEDRHRESNSPSVLDWVTIEFRPTTTVSTAEENLTEGTLISLPSDSAAQSLSPEVRQSSSRPKKKQRKVVTFSEPTKTISSDDEHLTKGTLISLPSDSAAQSLPPDVKQSPSRPKRKQRKVVRSSGATSTVSTADEHLTEGTLISLPSDSAAQSLPPDVKQSPSRPKRKQRKVVRSSDTVQAETITLEDMLAENDDDELDGDIIIEPEFVDIMHFQDQYVPEELSSEAAVWLESEDRAADEVFQHLILQSVKDHRKPASADRFVFDWNSKPTEFHGQREKFTGTPGPTFPVNEYMRPMDIFLKYFDTTLLDHLVSQTNAHAIKQIKNNKCQKSRLLQFVQVSRDEMVVFLAIFILQGLAPLSLEKDYWRENGYLTLKYFKKLMSLERYQILKRLLHFENDLTDSQTPQATPTDNTDQNKLRKIAPVLDHLNKKFSELYRPAQDVAIDESLLKWHGKLSFAQKIATKAARVGVKSYELCESATGYLWRFFVYTGKSQTASEAKEAEEQADEEPQSQTDASQYPPPSNSTAKIVLELVEPLLNQGYTVVMDNFYNSPLLARYLKANGTDCYGTLRVNRAFVPDSIKSVTKASMRMGELYQSYCRDLYVMLWRDNNIFAMLSTYHTGEIGGKEKYGKYRYKPQIVLDYNMTMGSVDRKDALLANHPIERSRNMMWYKKVFRRILNVTILNSYIILKTKNKQITHRAFRVRLAEDLIKTFKTDSVPRPIEVKINKWVSEPGFRRPILEGNHYAGLDPTRRARCVACKKSRSRYFCKQCNVTLCFGECFERFHQDSNL